MRRHLLRATALSGVAGLMITGQALAQQSDGPPLETIVVTGSRIPRVATEGPAPITAITADTIKEDGFASVPDIMRSLTQNGGETQTQQSSSGMDWTPGAQQVDLRGLGPNHTLVLVNGRRIADFPLPFNGKSAFTDISNIPISMIDQIQELSGSASAVYGSDAISGVVNFILKKKVDGTTVDVSLGGLEHGGGDSQRVSVSSGFSAGKFDMALGLELNNQKPLWAFDRARQASTLRSPDSSTAIARRDFLRIDPSADVYLDPGASTCAGLSHLNGGTEQYVSRPNWGAQNDDGSYQPGYYCGSYKSIGYGTIISQRQSANLYAALNYEVNSNLALFADIQGGWSETKQFQDTLSWQFQDANGSSDGIFYNQKTGGLDEWFRRFTPEEAGGLSSGYITNISHTVSITPGARGSLGHGWDFETAYNFSQYKSDISWPEVVASKANALFLGPQLGVDPDSGYPIFNADPTRLYTPLTRAEYNSITARTTYRPVAEQQNLSFQINKADLFNLPAGPVGFAGVAEYGTQSYKLGLDPLATVNYYYHLRDADGSGSRNHWGLSYEFRAPLLKSLEFSTAGRYDAYSYGGTDIGKFTYNGGLEWRPTKTLLLRAAYGTGFRAPDLHYLFAKPGISHPSGNDYLTCREEGYTVANIGDCSLSDTGVVKIRLGNRSLKPELSTSLNYGFVWSPVRQFDVSFDYFRVELTNGVLDMDLDTVLREEADCKLGRTDSGAAVDPNSPTCKDVVSRIVRYDTGPLAGQINTVTINPINVANETTDGLDIAAHYRWPTDRFGTFKFSFAYTYVFDHKTQQYPSDPKVNELQYFSNYDIPRSKGGISVDWTYDKLTLGLHGDRLDRIPNYAETGYIHATYMFNATAQYKFDERTRLTLTIDNLFDQGPPRDSTYSSYPYYDTSWFDTEGRSFTLHLTRKFGGGPL